MAVVKIALPVVWRQNTNMSSHAYGKYYLETLASDPLLLAGLMRMCAWDQSVYTPEIVQGVIDAISKVMLELMREGQPVKWDKLGTFVPYCETTKGGVSEATMISGDFKAPDCIKGVHIRFIPENTNGDQITSRQFKDLCKFDVKGVVKRVRINETEPAQYITQFKSLEEWKSKH